MDEEAEGRNLEDAGRGHKPMPKQNLSWMRQGNRSYYRVSQKNVIPPTPKQLTANFGFSDLQNNTCVFSESALACNSVTAATEH